MKYKIGMKIEIDGEIYKIKGTYKRSWLLEKDGQNFKCTSKMLDRINNNSNNTGHERNTRKRIRQRKQPKSEDCLV